MKTTPMQHQVEGQARLDANPEAYALAAEQGTGKTWMILNDAERQFTSGRIDALLVIAPKGVHTNWVRREIPAHLSIDAAAMSWKPPTSKKLKDRFRALLNFRNADHLVVFSINIDAMITEKGFKYCLAFMRRYRTMLVIDESQRIKNPTAARSKKCHALAPHSTSRRIASGTMIGQGPQDIFSQFEFLQPGCLGTTSYRAFVAEYADVLPPNHHLVQHAKAKSKKFGNPQIIRRDEEGRPVYKNLDKLNARLQPLMYRVLKKDCLDLPEKIYKVQYFELNRDQRKVYDEVREDLRYEYAEGEMDSYTALTVIGKLRQAAAGFINVDGVAQPITEDNPRLKALMEIIADTEGSVIIWATHRAEIAAIEEALKAAGETTVSYHGGVKDADREDAIDRFQSGDARFFIGHPVAGGTGLTLTRAETAIYYSCDYWLEMRLQSEDRNHRIGTKNNVVYWDLVAEDTIDEKIAAALQSKKAVAGTILDGEGIGARVLGGGESRFEEELERLYESEAKPQERPEKAESDGKADEAFFDNLFGKNS